jgi:hypothetical protein
VSPGTISGTSALAAAALAAGCLSKPPAPAADADLSPDAVPPAATLIPRAVAVADFDDDNAADLARIGHDADGLPMLLVWRGGGAAFAAEPDVVLFPRLATGGDQRVLAVASGDLDAMSPVELVVLTIDAAALHVWIYRAGGDGRIDLFRTSNPLPLAGSPDPNQPAYLALRRTAFATVDIEVGAWSGQTQTMLHLAPPWQSGVPIRLVALAAGTGPILGVVPFDAGDHEDLLFTLRDEVYRTSGDPMAGTPIELATTGVDKLGPAIGVRPVVGAPTSPVRAVALVDASATLNLISDSPQSIELLDPTGMPPVDVAVAEIDADIVGMPDIVTIQNNTVRVRYQVEADGDFTGEAIGTVLADLRDTLAIGDFHPALGRAIYLVGPPETAPICLTANLMPCF